MGHNIDMSNGRANVMYVDETMGDRPLWHGLGTPVKEAATAEDAIVLAGLDFHVDLLPVYAKHTAYGFEDDYLPVDKSFALTRTDTLAPLAIVGSKYTPIQNKQCFSFMDSVAGPERLVRYNTAGSLFGGKKIWLAAELTNITIEPVPNDVVKTYLVIIKGHDGITPLMAFFTTVRIVCANTMNAAITEALKSKANMVKIRHTRSAMDRVHEAKRILGLAVERSELHNSFARYLASKQMDTAKWNDFLDTLFPLPELEQGKETSRALTLATSKHDLLTELFESGKGTDIPGVRGTAWGALNAVTEYTTHYARTRTGVAKESPKFNRARNESLLASSWFGSSAKLNDRAMDLLVNTL